MAETAVDLTVPPLADLHRRRSEKWALHDGDVLSLTVAEMDFPIAAPIREALFATIERNDLGYALPGAPALAEALVGFADRRLGWAVDPEQVTVVPDVMVGLIELCRAIAAPGHAVAFASPGYPPFFVEFQAAGFRVVTVDLDSQGKIDLEALDSVLARRVAAFVLSNPHNPTGHVATREELARLAERCAAAETWVLADEIHAPLVFPGAEHIPWLEVSDAAREYGVALTSASKAFNLAALKTAFIVTAAERSREMVKRLPAQHDHASLLGTIAAEVAFTAGDTWLEAVVGQLQLNRTQLAADLAAHLPQVDWIPPQATYLAWVNCTPLGLGDEPASAFLAHGRVALGRGLDYGQAGAGYVRLNFATSPTHLRDAVRRMARTVER
ncbi:MAG: aminotransferase class I/II-fold pyridoxal phosphate-dependent enzyme [Solirubrobacterales bacterium]|nr:aminotransferase class I/II-fold pyridoxal phosphate-dependent enzyme [Solirubrobacterales bacterium]